MTLLKRGMLIDVNLDPTQGSETGKARLCIIVTEWFGSAGNCLPIKSSN